MPPRRVVRRSPLPVVSSLAAPGRDLTVGIDASLTGYGLVLWWTDSGEHQDILITTAADGDTYAIRLQQIHDAVVAALLPVKDSIRLICMERPAYAASGAFTGGLVHATTALALLHVFGPGDPRMSPVLVAGNTLKKFVTGKGVGKKQLMVKYVLQKWGFDTDDDNLADAYGLARLAAAILSGPCQHKYEQECVETVVTKMDPVQRDALGVTRPSPTRTTPSATRRRAG